MDKNKHKLYMAQILSLIFKDKDICNVMAFKGGTALMFFHNLNRFSTDLDFNLLVPDKLDMLYDRVRAILTRFGTIDDEAKNAENGRYPPTQNGDIRSLFMLFTLMAMQN